MKNLLLRITFIIYFIAICVSLSNARAETKFSVKNIPDSLKYNANAVFRYDKMVLEIISTTNATLTVSYAVTILNKSAYNYSLLTKNYGKFNKIKNIKGAVYDASGELVKKFKDEDIDDYSATEGSLYQDNRVKFINPDYRKYPFTVEYSYEVRYYGSLIYPAWVAYPGYDVAIEQSSYRVRVPENIQFRYFTKNLEKGFFQNISDGYKEYNWEVKNLVALEKELYTTPLQDIIPVVYIAPNDFSMDGYDGNLASWQNFGKWIYDLNEGLSKLPEETQQDVKSIIKDADNDYDRCKLLYEYLQDNTRYVSVQIGIGGWKPIDAKTVDRLGYGDCKALTNYMQALLEVAGIKSFYAVVNAGPNAEDIILEFPSIQSNHAILCIPIKNDTTWLECTSQRRPFGYIGTFTDDRNVLLITDEGGKIVRTKKYTHLDNQKNCKVNVFFDIDGNASLNISTDYQGMFYDWMQYVSLKDEHDQKQIIRDDLHIPNLELKNYSFQETRDIIPSMKLNVDLSIYGYGTSFGNKMMITLNMINKSKDIPNRKKKRKSDILIRRSYIETDTIIYHIPPDYAIYKTSSERNIESDFGSFYTSITIADSKIIYVRYLKMNKCRYSPEAFNRFMDFVEEVKKADNDKAVLVKN